MKWFKQSALVAIAVLGMAACTNDSSSVSQDPTSPLNKGTKGQGWLWGKPHCADPLVMIPGLFPRRMQLDVAVQYGFVIGAYLQGDSTKARNLAAKLYAFTLQAYNNGALINAGTPAGAQAVANFIDAVFCTIGMTVNLSPNLNDNVVAIVPPNTDTIIATGTNNAGVQLFAAQQLPQEVVVITGLPSNASSPGCPQYTGPLCTPLAQFPPYYDYSLTPAPVLGASAPPFVVEICPSSQINVPVSQLYIAHNVTSDSAAVVPKSTTNLGLQCDGGSTGMGPSRSLFELARNGRFSDVAKELGSRLSDFMVKDAYALVGGVTGQPRSFSPFGIVDVNDFVAYQNGGYTYHAPPPFTNPPPHDWGDIQGFEQPSYVPDPSWVVNTSSYGNSPFGSGDVGNFGCVLELPPSPLNLVWPSFNPIPASTGNPNADSSTIFLLRNTFYVPASWTQDLYVGIAVDNDVEVFVNGNPITPIGGPAAFLIHDGCVQQDEFVLDVPNSMLNLGGTNLLAIRARDRGGDSYIDARLSPPAPLLPASPPPPPAP